MEVVPGEVAEILAVEAGSYRVEQILGGFEVLRLNGLPREAERGRKGMPVGQPSQPVRVRGMLIGAHGGLDTARLWSRRMAV